MNAPPVLPYERYFHLRDNPFAPEQGLHVRPDIELKLFEGQLDAFRYFIQLEAFAKAQELIDDLVYGETTSLLTGTLPCVIIVGPRGAGRGTMADYLAYRLREECASHKMPLPSMQTVREDSEDTARVLQAVRAPVLEHLRANGVPVGEVLQNVGIVDGGLPEVEPLSQLYRALAGKVKATLPILVLAVEGITASREKWLTTLRNLLGPLRVFLVFFTEDTSVATLFVSKPDTSVRLRVDVGELKEKDQLEFLQCRFKTLETAERADLSDPLFPYTKDVLRQAFPAGEKTTIKQFVTLCSAALDSRLSDFRRAPPVPGADASVSWDNFKRALARRLGRMPGAQP